MVDNDGIRNSGRHDKGRRRSLIALVLSTVLVTAGTVATVEARSALASPAPTASADRAVVQLFPQPGTTTLSPRSQLSFRGPGLTSVADLSVVGAKSGAHPGHWIAHSDHGGASFVPDHPFTPGETLTVTTSRTVVGATGGRITYRVARPAHLPSSPPTATAPPAPTGGPGAAPAPGVAAPSVQTGLAQPPTPPGPAGPYRSRPDLDPPQIATTVAPGVAPGLLLGTSDIAGNGVQAGTIIYDNQGQPVWFNPANFPFDLKKVTYQGQPALSYFEADNAGGPGINFGHEVVVDTSYRQIGTIQAGNGYERESHDLQYSPDGTKALMTIYAPVSVDLSPYGGPTDGVVFEGIIQEVDIATGAVTFEWHSLGSGAFPITDSYVPLNSSPVDYFHLNSVAYDTDGKYLFSARHVSVVGKIDPSSGAVLWRMGGKRNQITFTDGDGGPSWPHDVRRAPDGTISVFDNGNSRNPSYSRGVFWAVDETNLTAHVAVQYRHDPDFFGGYTGSNRVLPNGNVLIDWGNLGRTTEYAAGQPIFEAQYTAGDWSYRTQRADWHATPARPPDMAVDRPSATTATGYASWNGATEVATWELWGGPDFQHLRRLNAAPRSGFETTVTASVQDTDRVFQVRALDGSGQTIGQSGTTPDAIQAKYASLGGSGSFLGSPVSGEQSIAGGLEQDYSQGSIYWSQATGAHEVHGAIGQKYQALGGPNSVLGFPVTDETGTPDGVGRFNHFSSQDGFGASIYWTPSTGAWSIHGAIRAKWASLGWEQSFMGYPTTDETGTPDGVGRFNHFSSQDGFGASIYWTPSTGAWSIHGAIRARWAFMGWERSCLGYPVTDEFGIPNGRQSNLQGGWITYSFSSGQTNSSC
jgi:hypothetical protein